MKNKKKILIISIMSIILILAVIGVTFAIFSYSQTGENNQLITGDIYMHYKESNTLTIENALPSNTYDANKYFEFTITGKNTNTLYDIWYDINLNRGEVPTGKLEANRIADNYIKFRLTEFVENENTHQLEETEIFTNKSYNNLTSTKRIHVDTIDKNTTSEITRRYRVYMWISNDIVIGNTDGAMSMSAWNNAFASIKVSVTGDFEEKEVNPSTSASCFTTSDNGDNTLTITGYVPDSFEVNTNMTSEELQTCVNFATDYWGSIENQEAFCNGTGTIWGETFQDNIDNGVFDDNQLDYLVEQNILNIVSVCPRDVVIPTKINNKNVTTIGNFAFQYNRLTSVTIPNSVTTIGRGAFSDNRLTSVNIPNSVTAIGNSVFGYNRLTSVNIPNSVTTIGPAAFSDNQLTSIEIPNSVTQIDVGAFSYNQLTSIEIPNSVSSILDGAFKYNLLTNVTIGNGITSISEGAFSKLSSASEISNNITYYDNPNLTSITINKSCSDIRNMSRYPWLSQYSPYTAPGVTIYGSNSEVCATF